MTMRCLGYALLVTLGSVRAAAGDEPHSFRALDLSGALAPAALIDALAGKRVVFVGETHTRYGDHLNRLESIEQLHSHEPAYPATAHSRIRWSGLSSYTSKNP